MAERADKGRLAAARAYPFAAPDHDFVFARGKAWPIEGGRAKVAGADVVIADLRAGKTALLSYGSNRSPARLALKYEDEPAFAVQRAWLADFDIGFAAHFAHYGSIPAGPVASPGTRVLVSVLWLDGDQLAAMHATEALGHHYAYGLLHAGIELAEGDTLQHAGVYAPLHGCLLAQDNHAAMAALTAVGRTLPTLDQAATLARMARRLEPSMHVDAFVLRLTEDAAWRLAMTRGLRLRARDWGGADRFERLI